MGEVRQLKQWTLGYDCDQDQKLTPQRTQPPVSHLKVGCAIRHPPLQPPHPYFPSFYTTFSALTLKVDTRCKSYIPDSSNMNIILMDIGAVFLQYVLFSQHSPFLCLPLRSLPPLLFPQISHSYPSPFHSSRSNSIVLPISMFTFLPPLNLPPLSFPPDPCGAGLLCGGSLVPLGGHYWSPEECSRPQQGQFIQV